MNSYLIVGEMGISEAGVGKRGVDEMVCVFRITIFTGKSTIL